jgi:hypothetical protein
MMRRTWEMARGLIVPRQELVGADAGIMASGAGSGAAYSYLKLSVANAVSGNTQSRIYEVTAYADPASLVNLVSGGTASASSVASGLPASNAVDGNIATYHANNVSAFPYDWIYQFASPVSPTLLGIRGPNPGPEGITVWGSNNGSTWTQIGTIATPDSQFAADSVDSRWPLTGIEFWRVFVTQAPSNFMRINEYKILNGATNLLTGGVMSAKSASSSSPTVINSGSGFWQNNSSDGLATEGTWFGYALPVGQSIISAGKTLSIKCDATGTNGPQTFKLQKTTDGGQSWTDVLSISGITWTTGQTKTWAL